MFFFRRKREKQKENVVQTAEPMIDDISYIQEIKHLSGKVGFFLWHQYDVLLATRIYGWETMVDWAAYLEFADIDNIETITTADLANESETELIDDYRQSKGGIKEFKKLTEERGSLSIGGYSRTLKGSVKIVWFNQTRVLRFFTQFDDETLMTKYVETVIRRTFGTEDAMKLARPVPKG